MHSLKENGQRPGLVEVLDRVADRIRDLEEKAGVELHENADPEASASLLREKAELLADLPRITAPYIGELPADERFETETLIEGFAAGARQALALNSVFYMANLLYDEDHRQGESNNLEALNVQVKNSMHNEAN